MHYCVCIVLSVIILVTLVSITEGAPAAEPEKKLSRRCEECGHYECKSSCGCTSPSCGYGGGSSSHGYGSRSATKYVVSPSGGNAGKGGYSKCGTGYGSSSGKGCSTSGYGVVRSVGVKKSPTKVGKNYKTGCYEC